MCPLQFSRAWIVQEIGTTAPATFYWGDAEIDWIILHRVCQHLTDYYHLRAQFGIRTDIVKYSFQRFVEADKTTRHANRYDFIYELHRARHLHVSDKRDRVFAMLGHYSIRTGENEALKALQADYTKTADEVYTEVTVRALTGGSTLIALAAVQHSDLANSTEQVPNGSLPSWVADWDTWETKILSEPISTHCAHGNSHPKVEIEKSSLLLRAYGVMVDTIDSVSRPLKDRDFYPLLPGQNLAIQTLWQEICHKDSFNLEEEYPNGEGAFFAYVQTLSDGSVTTSSWDSRSYHAIQKTEWLAQGAAYLTMAMGQTQRVSPAIYELAASGDHSKWSRAANGATKRRKFARTENGYYVLGPKVLEKGDIVCVLFGGKAPFCLRPQHQGYVLVGECYMHGYKDGEAMKMLEQGELLEQAFDILQRGDGCLTIRSVVSPKSDIRVPSLLSSQLQFSWLEMPPGLLAPVLSW